MQTAGHKNCRTSRTYQSNMILFPNCIKHKWFYIPCAQWESSLFTEAWSKDFNEFFHWPRSCSMYSSLWGLSLWHKQSSNIFPTEKMNLTPAESKHEVSDDLSPDLMLEDLCSFVILAQRQNVLESQLLAHIMSLLIYELIFNSCWWISVRLTCW